MEDSYWDDPEWADRLEDDFRDQRDPESVGESLLRERDLTHRSVETHSIADALLARRGFPNYVDRR